MTFSEAFKIMRRYVWLIIAAAVIAGVFGYYFSARQTKVYETSITILVGQNQGLAENLNLTTALQEVANSMSKMIVSRTVAEKVVGDLGLDTSPDAVMGAISAQPVQQTQLINVTVTDTDPVEAAAIANGVGNAFSELIQTTESSRSGLTAQVWQGAGIPGAPVRPTPTRNAILAVMMGLGLGIGIAFLLDRFDTRWRSNDEVEETLGLPILGVIPQMTNETLSETSRY
ncbi:MAG: YveK family protein [Thermoleophilia bacterium]